MTVPDSHVDILEKGGIGFIATERPDGNLQNNPTLVMWDGERARVSTTKSRKKFENLQQDARATLVLPDADNPYRYVEIRGTAQIEDDPDRSFIDSIAQKYMGKDQYPPEPGEDRVVVTIEPEQVSAVTIG